MATRVISRILAMALLGMSEAAWAAAKSPSNSDCLECHSDKTLFKTNAQGRAISLFVDNSRFTNSVHRTNACASCHTDITDKHPDDNLAARPVNCTVCHPYQSETYRGSAHGLALEQGKSGAATCVDCHGKHDVIPHNDPSSPLYFTRLGATCGECHPEIAEQVQESVHGKSVALGHREAATCTGCHSEHAIEDLRNYSPIRISGQVCSRCHASERISTKYRMPSDRVKTFMQSYHGLASQYGSLRVANCASCHGVHLILPSTDPASMINTNNLVKTCGKCHPGATENFAFAKIHIDENYAGDFGGRVNAWVRRIYLWIIGVTIGLMLLYNFLSWRHKIMASLHSPDRIVLRMDRVQRVQHLLLGLSFFALAITGFALKFPDSLLARALGSDETFRRISHRAAGVVMLVLAGYHLVYLLTAQEGRRLLVDLLPGGKDFRDLLTNLRHLLSPGQPKAMIGRFSYVHKMEYWAVVWGTIIMGATGLAIWFKMAVTLFLPRWAIDVAITIHYYEAILACAAIVVWHFYHVIFDPETYPMNWAFLDGYVSAHWHREEHPLDVAARNQAGGASAASTPSGTVAASQEPAGDNSGKQPS